MSDSQQSDDDAVREANTFVAERRSIVAADAAAIALAHSEALAKLGDIQSIATQAIASKSAIGDNQAVIAQKSDHIQGAQEHADKVRSDLDRALTGANLQVTEAEGHKSATPIFCRYCSR